MLSDFVAQQEHSQRLVASAIDWSSSLCTQSQSCKSHLANGRDCSDPHDLQKCRSDRCWSGWQCGSPDRMAAHPSSWCTSRSLYLGRGSEDPARIGANSFQIRRKCTSCSPRHMPNARPWLRAPLPEFEARSIAAFSYQSRTAYCKSSRHFVHPKRIPDAYKRPLCGHTFGKVPDLEEIQVNTRTLCKICQ